MIICHVIIFIVTQRNALYATWMEILIETA